jgi:tRNA A37 threonylcarbamoyladenosine dehydratase
MQGGVAMAEKMSKNELLDAIDKSRTIADLFRLVKEQDINMRMHTVQGASNTKPKKLEIRSFPPNATYLDRLKAAVRLTVENTK